MSYGHWVIPPAISYTCLYPMLMSNLEAFALRTPVRQYTSKVAFLSFKTFGALSSSVWSGARTAPGRWPALYSSGVRTSTTVTLPLSYISFALTEVIFVYTPGAYAANKTDGITAVRNKNNRLLFITPPKL